MSVLIGRKDQGFVWEGQLCWGWQSAVVGARNLRNGPLAGSMIRNYDAWRQNQAASQLSEHRIAISQATHMPYWQIKTKIKNCRVKEDRGLYQH